MSAIQLAKPWYRERYFWYLMSGPAIVIVAVAITTWFVISSDDGLVTEDYYKDGLAIEKTLARSRLAETLGLEVRARFTTEGVSLGLQALSKPSDFQMPKSITLTLSHPTRAGMDQQLVLTRSGDKYGGSFRLPASGHWLVLIEDDAKTWRMMGNIVLPAIGDVVIGGVLEKQDN